MSEEKNENLEKAALSDETTADETPYVVMGPSCGRDRGGKPLHRRAA